jgi:hypothetical protein
MYQPDRTGAPAYSVRISREDGKVVRETPFAELGQALLHFHEMVRNAPQPNVYVQLRQYAAGGEPEILETGFYYGSSRPGQV